MLNPLTWSGLMWVVILGVTGCRSVEPQMKDNFSNYMLSYDTPVDPVLQTKLEKIDADLRNKYGMTTAQTAVGLLDLNTLRHLNQSFIRNHRDHRAASFQRVRPARRYGILDTPAKRSSTISPIQSQAPSPESPSVFV